MPKKRRRVLVLSDFHCGSVIGLTPPEFDDKTEPELKPQLWNMRRIIWNFFADTVDRMGKIDLLIFNGDAIDGKGEASGGTELLTADRNIQVEMAIAAINHVGAEKTLMSFGTAYHTGKREDWEDGVADGVGADKISGEDNVNVNGCVINYKHHIGRSSVPHGRHTAVAKAKLWNDIWSQRGEYPEANILIRSHVHYFTYCGGSNWLALTTPALQGYGSKYGERRVDGTVDIGLVIFNIARNGEFTWKPVLLRLPLRQPTSL